MEENTQIVEQKESKSVAEIDTDFSKGIFGTGNNFKMATQMAKAFAASTIVPREYQGNWANGLVAIDMANRFKTSPLTVMQNLDVIQGRPAWRATFLIAMINVSGKYDIELQFEEEKKNGKPFSCTCWTMRDGRKITGITVDMDMAVAEGWTNKNGSKWKTMPQVMLRYRAASFFARMNCPELTNGLYTTEEVLEMAPEEYKIYDLEKQVNDDLAQASTVEFKVEEDAIIDEPKATESIIPDFMKAE